jgi:hypothetical protein
MYYSRSPSLKENREERGGIPSRAPLFGSKLRWPGARLLTSYASLDMAALDFSYATLQKKYSDGIHCPADFSFPSHVLDAWSAKQPSAPALHWVSSDFRYVRKQRQFCNKLTDMLSQHGEDPDLQAAHRPLKPRRHRFPAERTQEGRQSHDPAPSSE